MIWSLLFGEWFLVLHENSNSFSRRIALVDCNNFYASCERVFNPAWEGRPMAVLSNNDGCIIARSNETKALGIPMGAPYFKVKDTLKKHKVVTVSSNYALYGDMSSRVMDILSSFTPHIEIYSIDEAFLDLSGFKAHQFSGYARGIARRVKQWTGIPVGIGIGPTKVLAKIANRIAKKQKIPSGVFDIGDASELNDILESVSVEDIWDIGGRLSEKLKALSIFNARQLRDANPTKMKCLFSVTLECIILELRGVLCLELEDVEPKKQIIASRSFGKRVTKKKCIAEALAQHTSRAAEKLRRQGSVSGTIVVFISTSRHSLKRPHTSLKCSLTLPVPSSDSLTMIKAVHKGLEHIFKPGLEYVKSGVMLNNIMPVPQNGDRLFCDGDSQKSIKLMTIMDKVNRIYGRSTVISASEGIKKSWQMKRQYVTSPFTTQWEGILTVR